MLSKLKQYFAHLREVKRRKYCITKAAKIIESSQVDFANSIYDFIYKSKP